MAKQQTHKTIVLSERKRHKDTQYYTVYRVKCESCAYDITSYSKIHAMKLKDTHRRSPHRMWLQ